MVMSVIGFQSWASETNSDDSKKGEKAAPITTMNVEIVDVKGDVKYTDVVTKTDPTLDYNLEELPLGEYTVRVKNGTKVINTIKMSNMPVSQDVITVIVLDAQGNQVYTSKDSSEMYNLEEMPKGEYTLNVYRGNQLINTNKLSQ
jgi:hypothetical protein